MSLSAARIRPSRPHAPRAWLALAALLLALATAILLPLQAGSFRDGAGMRPTPDLSTAIADVASDPARRGLPGDAATAHGQAADNGAGEPGDASLPLVHGHMDMAASSTNAGRDPQASAHHGPPQPRAQAPPAQG